MSNKREDKVRLLENNSFKKDVDVANFSNEQIKIIVHHFTQKVATIDNSVDVLQKLEYNIDSLTDMGLKSEEELRVESIDSIKNSIDDLQRMLNYLTSKYEKD